MRIAQIESAVLPMAKAALDAGQFETARRLYTRLLEADPVSVDARRGLGDLALAQNEPSRAATWYLAAASHTRTVEERHAVLLAHGRAALAAGDLEAARASFGRLADPRENASNADMAWGFNGVGIVDLLEGRPREAAASMEQAVLRLPNEAKFHGNLARALAMASRADATASDATAGTATERAIAATRPIDGAATRPGIEQSQSDPANGGAKIVEAPAPPLAAATSEPVLKRAPAGSFPEVPEADASDSAPSPAAPEDVATPDAPDLKSETPLDAIAFADPIESTPTAPESGPAEPQQEASDVAVQATQQDAQQSTAVERSETASARPRLSFPGAYLVHVEGGRFLQVGAFAREENAQNSRSRLLEAIRLPVRIESAETDNPIFRVRIGPIPSSDVLNDLAVDLGVDRARLGILPVQDEDEAPIRAVVVPKIREPLPEGKRETPIHVVENGAGFVQVGAYANHDSAIALASKLRDLTEHPVTLSEIAGGNSTLYRVRIGPVDADSRPDLLRQIAAR